MHSEDIQQIALDFNKLNKFSVVKNGKDYDVAYDEDAILTNSLQKELLDYAVVAFGLQFSSSNFSNYISPGLFKDLDDRMNEKLDYIANGLESPDVIGGTIPHFRLSYLIANANRLPFVANDQIEKKRMDLTGGGYKNIYSGSDEVSLVHFLGELLEKSTVYYDRKVVIDPTKDIQWAIKDGFGSRSTVFIYVGHSQTHAYYQVVAKQSESFFLSLDRKGLDVYNTKEYFDPAKLSIPFIYQEEDKLYSYNTLPEDIKVGDRFYAFPNYNYDRLDRQLVELVSASGYGTGSYPGYVYTVKVIDETPPIVAPLPTITPSNPDLSFATFVSDDLAAEGASIQKDQTTGKYNADGATYDAVTSDIIPQLQQRPVSKYEGLRFGERAAESKWGNLPETEVLIIDGKEFTKQDYAEYAENLHARIIAKGDLIHLHFHEFFSSGQAKVLANQMIAAKSAEFEISTGELEWLNATNIKNIIMNRTGTDFFNPKGEDRILTELPIRSRVLGMGGTVDMMIDHGNNILSLYDFKTGYGYEAEFQSYLLKYGDTFAKAIWDEPRSRAKLQLMLYAAIIKSERPDVRFRNLKVIHIVSESRMHDDSERNNVDPAAYLQIVEKFIKDTRPSDYKSLKDSKLFEPSEYMSYDSRAIKPIREGALPSLELKLRILELQSLIMYDKNITQKMTQGGIKFEKSESGKRQERIKQLMTEIIELKRNPDVNYNSWDSDMGWMDSWLGSASASTNPYVQLYYSLLTEQKQKSRNLYETWRAQYDALYKQLLNESGLKASQNMIGGVNREKLFAFAYKTVVKGNTSVVRYITKDDTE
jgi:hypothetical protein